MADEHEKISVLLEFDSSKIPADLSISPEDHLNILEGKLRRIDKDVHLTINYNSDDSSGNIYILQRYSKIWSDFIDVQDVSEIENGDHLKAVHLPTVVGKKQSIDVVGEANSILTRVKKPSDSHAKALTKLFTSSAKFNPRAQCVANEAHSKRKKFEGISKAVTSKDSAVTVVMLRKYQSQIPKGECRQDLVDNDRIKKVNFNRDMRPDEVKNKILSTFKCKDFIILECAKGGYLLKTNEKELTSQMAIDRRGALYLSENLVPAPGVEVKSSKKKRKRVSPLPPEYTQFCDSDSDAEFRPSKSTSVRKTAASRMILASQKLKTETEGTGSLRKPLIVSSDEETVGNQQLFQPRKPQQQSSALSSEVQQQSSTFGEVQQQLSSVFSAESSVAFDEVQQQSSGTFSDKQQQLSSIFSEESSATPGEVQQQSSQLQQQYWAESREIIMEQDQALAESIRIDSLKKKKKHLKEEWDHLRELCRRMFDNMAETTETLVNIAIVLPGSKRIECKLPANSPTKRLYEFVLANCDPGPFAIFTRLGHKMVKLDNHSTLCPLLCSNILIVEETGNYEDFLAFFPDPDEECSAFICQQELNRRQSFLSSLDSEQGSPHLIRRSHIYEDVIKLYSNFHKIANENPFRIAFDDEEAIDTGGVCRDMYSGFWKSAFDKHFDGSGSVIPATHPNVDMSSLPTIGTILSHGYFVCGFLPVHVAFPVLAAILLGPTIQIKDSFLRESFVNFLNHHDADVLKEAFCEIDHGIQMFSSKTSSSLLSLFSGFGSRQIPSPQNLVPLLTNVARHEFLVKPLGALYAMNSGVPVEHRRFWQEMKLNCFFEVYMKCTPTAENVLRVIREPDYLNESQASVFNYLLQYIGNMHKDKIRDFLRFVTGSSALVVDQISITFNSMSAGLCRRPIPHTCSSTLELPATYATFIEFSNEFDSLLSSDMAWAMNSL